jgi:hypothetical protein
VARPPSAADATATKSIFFMEVPLEVGWNGLAVCGCSRRLAKRKRLA